MRLRWILAFVCVLAALCQIGCASSINTVYKAQSLEDDQPCADIVVNGVSTTITHVYSRNQDGTVKADCIVIKDSPSMEILKTAYNLTPWGLLTRAFDATSAGVVRVPTGRVVLQVFSRRNIPLVREKPGPELVIPFGWYSLLAERLEADESYELDAAEKLGGPPVFSPKSDQHEVIGGKDAVELMSIGAPVQSPTP
jgi:hypothetical protein